MIGNARSGQALVNNDPFEAFRAAISHRYRIERELGRGGMATVYLAHELKHGRSVALKVLRPEIASVIGSERFLREIEVTAHFTHPNILPFYDSDEAVGRLFYVMPFVEGGTLKDRLARPPIPSIAEALSLTRQVAAGLTYAHQLGVVHRDIKPGNILLSSGHAFIADFGIARAVRQKLTEDQLTATGLALGTPAYMAPEQHVNSSVDGRADEYALACVLYEMLLGSPPSVYSSPNSFRRALRATRSDVPAAVEAALERALSVDASKRFPNVAEFAAALETAVALPTPVPSRRTKTLRVAAVGALALAISIAIWKWPDGGNGSDGNLASVPDTTRYAILPMEYQSGITQSINEEQLLHDGLARWGGISVVDHFQVRDALERHGSGPLTSQAALTIAKELGAGRFVRGEVSKVGDSLRIHATLYDVPAGGKTLSEGTIKLDPSLTGADSSFTSLARRLLLRGSSSESEAGSTSSLSLPARQAYGRGDDAIQAWDLAAADSAFATAGRIDPSYAEAHLWLALVRAWSGADPASWRYPASQAANQGSRLSHRDQLIGQALVAQSQGDLGRACPLWKKIVEEEPGDFVSWYGLATCKVHDDAVLRDGGSPSGWRFRTSYHSTLKAYQRAFELLPSILASHRSNSYQSLRYLLMTGPNDFRSGRAVPPDTGSFGARPAWQGDTLAFIPRRSSELATLSANTQPDSRDEAARHQRELFRQIATAWRAAAPQSVDALQAVALSLELLGDRSALDTLRRARELVRNPDERLRVAGAEVWHLVKFSLPTDVQGLRSARLLVDSLLRENPPQSASDQNLLAGLAAVTGRANLAAAYARVPRSPLALSRLGPALLAFASLGGPADSLIDLEQETLAAIEDGVPREERQDVRLEWVARAATIAFPDHRFKSIGDLAGRGDYLIDITAAWLDGDTTRVRRDLGTLAQARRRLDPSDLTFDALYPEASLLHLIGDDRGAAAWIDPTLAGLRRAAPQVLASPPLAGSLVRTALLRAEIALRLGDRPGALLWSKAVAELWTDADPFLKNRIRVVMEQAR